MRRFVLGAGTSVLSLALVALATVPASAASRPPRHVGKHVHPKAPVTSATVTSVVASSVGRIFGAPGRMKVHVGVTVECQKAPGWFNVPVGAVATLTETVPGQATPISAKAWSVNPTRVRHFCPGGKGNDVRIVFGFRAPPFLPTRGRHVPSGRSASISVEAGVLTKAPGTDKWAFARHEAACPSTLSGPCQPTATGPSSPIAIEMGPQSHRAGSKPTKKP